MTPTPIRSDRLNLADKPLRSEKIWIAKAVVGRLDDKGGIMTEDGGRADEFVHCGADDVWGEVGPIVECVTLPGKRPYRARVMQHNAGDGVCSLSPFRGGDEIAIWFPDGDGTRIPEVVGRCSSAKHPTPKTWDNARTLISLGEWPAEILHDSGAFIVWGKDGSISYKHPKGAFLQCDASGRWNVLDAEGNLIWTDSGGVQAVTGNGGAFKIGDVCQVITPGQADVQAAGVKLITSAVTMGANPALAASAGDELLQILQDLMIAAMTPHTGNIGAPTIISPATISALTPHIAKLALMLGKTQITLAPS